MRYVSINGKPVGRQPGGHVISRSAILILSGVLIGTTLTQGHMTGVAFGGFSAGIIGMISFYALDLVAERRRNQVVRRKLAAVDSALSSRLRRHVAPPMPISPMRRAPYPTAEASYLPVACGAR